MTVQLPKRKSRECAAKARSPRPQQSHHETANNYLRIVARLSERWRIIECKDQLQWILQKRDAQRAGQPRWTGYGYFRTRDALIRVSRALCERIDPATLAALASLPDRFGG
jgi:hypothetical protein